MSCGFVTVPLRHAQPNGPTIQLATVVLPPIDADRQPDPLFMAQGGPGGSTIDTYANYLIDSPTSRPVRNRDIVLWDQRGTLNSKPALLCPELTAADLREALAGSNPPDPNAPDPTRECGERLAALVGDLSAFNTAENADDVEDLRVALGYDQYNFYGVSYGTELGQFLMRQHPLHLRSVVLDAVVPLSYNIYTEPAFAKQRIGQKYFEACAADPRCDAAFPNLGQRYLAMIDRLNAEPVTVTVSPHASSQVPAGIPTPTPSGPATVGSLLTSTPFQIKLTGTLLESALYQALYSDAHDLIPLIVNRADQGDFSYISSLILPLTLFDNKSAAGMWMTVTCAERGDTDPNAVDYSQIVPRLADAERADAVTVVETCQQWQIELLPRTDLQAVRSDVPALLLSGAFDPITPPEYAETLLANLPNAKHVVFPYGSHGQAVTDPCTNRIIQDFVDDPTGHLDVTCATAQQARFRTEADLITLPPVREALEAEGIGGLLGVGVSAVPGLLTVALLMTALPVYAINWLVNLLRRRKSSDDERGDWTIGWSRAAPWLAVAATGVVLAFVVGLGVAFTTTLVTNESLLGLGAIPSTFRWVFYLPPLFLVLVGAMLVAAFALWKGERRSIVGRIYYSVLTLAALGALSSLFSLGVMGLWRA